MMKKCNFCNEEKDEVNFSKKSLTKCKQCVSAHRKKFYLENKERISLEHKKHYEKNKDHYLEKQKEYQKKHLDEKSIYDKKRRIEKIDQIKAYQKERYIKNREETISRTKKYKNDNKEKFTIWRRAYEISKRKTDIQFKISKSLRRRICDAIKSNTKAGSAVRDLGCSVEELKLHLESKFQDGMSWDNWSLHGWHIDHIKPLASFDLSDREQFLEACHYTNLQPLWAIDNLKKGDKII